MLAYERQSGLAVIEHAADEESVDLALRQVRDTFRLCRTVDHRHGCWLYQVWQEPADWSTVAEAQWIMDWTDRNGNPLPLSHGLVERVKAELQVSEAESLRRVAEANERQRAEYDRQTEEAQEWLAENVLRGMKETHSALFPRGQHLRRARDRARAKGKNV